MVKLRSFDAFPKLDETYAVQRQPGKPMTYLFIFISVIFLYLETSSWIGSDAMQRFDVDRGISDTFQINLDITLFRPCKEIGVFIQDLSDDSLYVNELVQARTINPYENSDEEWCQIGGIFDTNRVKGRLYIGGRGRNTLQNTSHYISELSFGQYYPQMVNPLDNTKKHFDTPVSLTYFLSIVPTTYEAFGVQLETNQYTVTESVNTLQGPNLVFEYDFDPIKVTVSDDRMPFFAWLTRAINIVGGVFFATKASTRLFKSKKRYGDSKGLLDEVK